MITPTSDAHGQAALMLCESLAYLLVEAGVLGREAVADAIEGVIEVQQGMAGREEQAGSCRTAVGLLTTIALSLRATGETGYE